MKRLLASFLSVFLVSGPAVLLPLHEARISAAESGHHRLADGGAAAALTPLDAHDHHGEAGCRVCLGVQLRLSTGLSARAAAPAAPAVRLQARSGLCAASLLLVSAAPRGPPSAS